MPSKAHSSTAALGVDAELELHPRLGRPRHLHLHELEVMPSPVTHSSRSDTSPRLSLILASWTLVPSPLAWHAARSQPDPTLFDGEDVVVLVGLRVAGFGSASRAPCPARPGAYGAPTRRAAPPPAAGSPSPVVSAIGPSSSASNPRDRATPAGLTVNVCVSLHGPSRAPRPDPHAHAVVAAGQPRAPVTLRDVELRLRVAAGDDKEMPLELERGQLRVRNALPAHLYRARRRVEHVRRSGRLGRHPQGRGPGGAARSTPPCSLGERAGDQHPRRAGEGEADELAPRESHQAARLFAQRQPVRATSAAAVSPMT